MSLKDEAKTGINETKGKKWPEDCAWPAPVDEYGGIYWDEDIIPGELDEESQELVNIKDYYDEQVELGRLDEEYHLVDDSDAWEPETGEEYWDGESFQIDFWRDDLTDALNKIKIDVCDSSKDPVIDISSIIGYSFINENLLRQAFTRRTFQIEHKLSGCSEELEFIGDSILSLVLTRELMKHFTELDSYDTEAPFRSEYDEGELSRIRSKFICKDHLGKRCEKLGLDKYILCGTGDECDLSAKEDVIEAVIAAVAIDCSWDMDVIEDVIDRLVDMQIDKPDRYLRKSYYELLNEWHMHFFHYIPEYSVYRKYNSKNNGRERYECTIKFQVPENDKDIWTSQIVNADGDTRSEARDNAASLAYDFILRNGLWLNLKNAGIEPDYESSINQLQELYQKKYIKKAVYDFRREGKLWYCNCNAGGVIADCKGKDKTEAKKKTSFEALVKLYMAAGCCKREWYDKMIENMYM